MIIRILSSTLSIVISLGLVLQYPLISLAQVVNDPPIENNEATENLENTETEVSESTTNTQGSTTETVIEITEPTESTTAEINHNTNSDPIMMLLDPDLRTTIQIDFEGEIATQITSRNQGQINTLGITNNEFSTERGAIGTLTFETGSNTLRKIEITKPERNIKTYTWNNDGDTLVDSIKRKQLPNGEEDERAFTYTADSTLNNFVISNGRTAIIVIEPILDHQAEITFEEDNPRSFTLNGSESYEINENNNFTMENISGAFTFPYDSHIPNNAIITLPNNTTQTFIFNERGLVIRKTTELNGQVETEETFEYQEGSTVENFTLLAEEERAAQTSEAAAGNSTTISSATIRTLSNQTSTNATTTAAPVPIEIAEPTPESATQEPETNTLATSTESTQTEPRAPPTETIEVSIEESTPVTESTTEEPTTTDSRLLEGTVTIQFDNPDNAPLSQIISFMDIAGGSTIRSHYGGGDFKKAPYGNYEIWVQTDRVPREYQITNPERKPVTIDANNPTATVTFTIVARAPENVPEISKGTISIEFNNPNNAPLGGIKSFMDIAGGSTVRSYWGEGDFREIEFGDYEVWINEDSIPREYKLATPGQRIPVTINLSEPNQTVNFTILQRAAGNIPEISKGTVSINFTNPAGAPLTGIRSFIDIPGGSTVGSHWGEGNFREIEFGTYELWVQEKSIPYPFILSDSSRQTVTIDSSNQTATVTFEVAEPGSSGQQSQINLKDIKGTCDCADGTIIRVSKDGQLLPETGTNANGHWIIQANLGYNAGTITAFLEGVTEEQQAVAVTGWNAADHISGLELKDGTLTIGSVGQSKIINNELLSHYDKSHNPNIFFDVVDNKLDTFGRNLKITDEGVYNLSPNQYGEAKVKHLNVRGTLNIQSNSKLIVTGDLDILGGSADWGTGTVEFKGDFPRIDLTGSINNTNFHDVTFSSRSTTQYNIIGDIAFDGTISTENATILHSDSNRITVNGSINVNDESIWFITDDIELNGAEDSITGSGSIYNRITFTPASQLFNISIGGQDPQLAWLTENELKTIKPNIFRKIQVGRIYSSPQTGQITINNLNVPNLSDLIFNGESLRVSGEISTRDGITLRAIREIEISNATQLTTTESPSFVLLRANSLERSPEGVTSSFGNIGAPDRTLLLSTGLNTIYQYTGDDSLTINDFFISPLDSALGPIAITLDMNGKLLNELGTRSIHKGEIINEGPLPINVSGTCEEIQGTGICPDNELKLVINGEDTSHTTQTTNGTWEFQNIQLQAGDVIMIYKNNVAESFRKAVAVTKYNGVGSIEDMVLKGAHLSIGSNQTTTITNEDLGLYEQVHSGQNPPPFDEDVIFQVDEMDLQTTGGTSLQIVGNSTYKIDDTEEVNSLFTQNLIINGKFHAGNDRIILNGQKIVYKDQAYALWEESTVELIVTNFNIEVEGNPDRPAYNNVEINGGITAINTNQDFTIDGALIIKRFTTINTGTHSLSINGSVEIENGDGLTLISDNLELNGPEGSITASTPTSTSNLPRIDFNTSTPQTSYILGGANQSAWLNEQELKTVADDNFHTVNIFRNNTESNVTIKQLRTPGVDYAIWGKNIDIMEDIEFDNDLSLWGYNNVMIDEGINITGTNPEHLIFITADNASFGDNISSTERELGLLARRYSQPAIFNYTGTQPLNLKELHLRSAQYQTEPSVLDMNNQGITSETNIINDGRIINRSRAAQSQPGGITFNILTATNGEPNTLPLNAGVGVEAFELEIQNNTNEDWQLDAINFEVTGNNSVNWSNPVLTNGTESIVGQSGPIWTVQFPIPTVNWSVPANGTLSVILQLDVTSTPQPEVSDILEVQFTENAIVLSSTQSQNNYIGPDTRQWVSWEISPETTNQTFHINDPVEEPWGESIRALGDSNIFTFDDDTQNGYITPSDTTTRLDALRWIINASGLNDPTAQNFEYQDISNNVIINSAALSGIIPSPSQMPNFRPNEPMILEDMLEWLNLALLLQGSGTHQEVAYYNSLIDEVTPEELNDEVTIGSGAILVVRGVVSTLTSTQRINNNNFFNTVINLYDAFKLGAEPIHEGGGGGGTAMIVDFSTSAHLAVGANQIDPSRGNLLEVKVFTNNFVSVMLDGQPVTTGTYNPTTSEITLIDTSKAITLEEFNGNKILDTYTNTNTSGFISTFTFTKYGFTEELVQDTGNTIHTQRFNIIQLTETEGEYRIPAFYGESNQLGSYLGWTERFRAIDPITGYTDILDEVILEDGNSSFTSGIPYIKRGQKFYVNNVEYYISSNHGLGAISDVGLILTTGSQAKTFSLAYDPQTENIIELEGETFDVEIIEEEGRNKGQIVFTPLVTPNTSIFSTRNTIDFTTNISRNQYIVEDLDQDGDLDIHNAYDFFPSKPTHSWENVNGDGSQWLKHENVQIPLTPYGGLGGGTLGDIDGDGLEDFVGRLGGWNILAWKKGTGSGALNAIYQGEIDTNNSEFGDIELADFDSDGDLDILTVSNDENEGLVWYENTNGDASNWERKSIDPTFRQSGGMFTLHAVDLNGDSKIDVFGHSRETYEMAWWENQHSVGYVPPSLSFNISPNTTPAGNVVVGTPGNPIGTFQFDTSNEAFIVEELDLAVNTSIGSENNITTVKLTFSTQQGTEITRTSYFSGGTAHFDGLTFFVPANGSAFLNVFADINTTQAGATIGEQIQVSISPNNFRATGISSNNIITSAGAENNLAEIQTIIATPSSPNLIPGTTTSINGNIASTAPGLEILGSVVIEDTRANTESVDPDLFVIPSINSTILLNQTDTLYLSTETIEYSDTITQANILFLLENRTNEEDKNYAAVIPDGLIMDSAESIGPMNKLSLPAIPNFNTLHAIDIPTSKFGESIIFTESIPGRLIDICTPGTLTTFGVSSANDVIIYYSNDDGNTWLEDTATSDKQFIHTNQFCFKTNHLTSFAVGTAVATSTNITNWTQLQAINNNLSETYTLMNNLDNSLPDYPTNGFTPIGSVQTPFTGTLNGNGKIIEDFQSSNGGLFDYIGSSGRVENLEMKNANVTTQPNTGNFIYGGILVNNLMSGTVSKICTQGTITSATYTGGIAGEVDNGGIIEDSCSNVTASGQIVGGLVGILDGSVTNSYALGSMNASSTGGGAIVIAAGIVGQNNGNITNVYAATSLSSTGGAVQWKGTIVGEAFFAGTVNNVYWDRSVTRHNESAGGGNSRNRIDMGRQSTFNGWDFNNIWIMPASNLTFGSYPALQWQDTVNGAVVIPGSGGGTTQTATLTTSLASLPNETYGVGENNVVLAQFSLREEEQENIQVNSITFTGYIDDTGNTNFLQGQDTANNNIYLRDLITNVTLTDPSGYVLAGPVPIQTDGTVTFQLLGSDRIPINQGETKFLHLRGDISTSGYRNDNPENIAFAIASETDIVAEVVQNGNSVTVNGTPNSLPNITTHIEVVPLLLIENGPIPTTREHLPGANDVTFACFDAIEAENTTDVKITDLMFTGYINDIGENMFTAGQDRTNNNVLVSDIVPSLTLTDELGNILAPAKDISALGLVTFGGLNLVVNQGGSRTLCLHGDISASAYQNNNPENIAFGLYKNYYNTSDMAAETVLTGDTVATRGTPNSLSSTIITYQTITETISSLYSKISDTEGNLAAELADSDSFGSSVTNLGDLDGDGKIEVAVGAPEKSNGGVVYILSLNSDGTVYTEKRIDAMGRHSEGRFGHAVANIGDIDNDGVTDLAVGAPYDEVWGGGGSLGGINAGAVYILLLNANGTVKASQEISNSPGYSTYAGNLDIGTWDLFGSAIAKLDDVDGDTVKDIAVGAMHGGDGTGKVYILFMNTDGTVKSHQKIDDTEGGFTHQLDSRDRFGSSLSSRHRQNPKTLLIGAKWDDDENINTGAVYAVTLNTNGTVNSEQKISALEGNFSEVLQGTPSSRFSGQPAGPHFGDSITNMGDLNGDGIGDIIVGASKDSESGSSKGAAYILFLNSDNTVGAYEKLSDLREDFTGQNTTDRILSDYDRFGSSLSFIPDINGDGRKDVMIGAYGDDDGGDNRGAIYTLFLPDYSGIVTIPALTPTPNNISISGNCTFGNIACADGTEVRIAVNETLLDSPFIATTQNSGTWNIDNINLHTGDVITTFLNGVHDYEAAVTVSKYDGTGDVTGVTLNAQHLILGSNDNTTVTLVDLAQYDNNISGNDLIFHNTNNTNSGYSFGMLAPRDAFEVKFLIKEGTTFQPDTTGNSEIFTDGPFIIEGNLVGSGNTFQIEDDLNIRTSGSVTWGSGSVNFDARPNALIKLEGDTTEFENISFNSGSSGGVWNIQGNFVINGDIELNADTTLQNETGDFTFNGMIDTKSSDLVLAAMGNIKFSGGTGSVTSSGEQSNLTIRPYNTSGDITIGDGIAAQLHIEESDINAIDNTFNSIAIGWQSSGTPTGTGNIYIGDIDFSHLYRSSFTTLHSTAIVIHGGDIQMRSMIAPDDSYILIGSTGTMTDENGETVNLTIGGQGFAGLTSNNIIATRNDPIEVNSFTGDWRTTDHIVNLYNEGTQNSTTGEIRVAIEESNAPGIDLSTIEFSISPATHANTLGQNALFTNLPENSTQTVTLNTNTIPNGYQITGGNTNNTAQATVVARQTVDVNFTLETIPQSSGPPRARQQARTHQTFQITNWTELQNMENDRTADYTLMNDLDENTAGYTTVIGDCHTGSGNGFDPIGDITEMPNFFTPFIGTFNGNGNTIDKFCSKNGGLFEVAYDDGTRIENLQMTNAKVENTAENTGALINWLHEQALIQNVGVNGTVNGAGKVGGLVGEQFAGTIRSSYSTATVTGTNYVGGLVGHMISFVMVGDTPQVSHIYDSYATGDVTFDGSADALNRIGGLVGQRFQGNIINSYTTGAVPSGIWESGGLVGGTGITFGGSETNNSYWDTQTTNQTSSSNGGTGKTTAEMQQQATFANWDFGSNWSIDANNYPRLQWQPALASEATSIELRSIYYNGRTIGAPQSTEDNIMSFEIVSPQNPETTPANIAFTFNIYGNSNLNTQQSGVPMKFKIGNNEIGTGSAQVVTTSWAQGTVTVPSSILLESGNILRVDLYMDTTQIMTSLVGTDNLNPGLVRVRGGQIDQSYGSFGGVPIDYRDSSIAGVPQGNTGITGNINVILNGGNGNELVVVNDSTGSEVFRQLGSGGIDLSNPTGIYTVYVDEFSLETNEYLEGVTEYSFLLDSNNTQKTATFTIEQDTHLVTPLVASGTNRIEENRNYPDGLPWGNPATFLSRQDAPNSITINNKHGLFSQAYYTNLGQAYYQVRARATDSNFYIEGPSRYGFKIEGENSTKVTNYTFKVNPIVNANNNIQVLIDDTNAPGIDLSTIEFSINPSSHTNVLGQNALFTNLLDGSTQTITLNTSTIPNGYQIVGGNTNNTQQTTIVAGQTIDISFALEAQATLLNITAGTFPSTNNPHASPITISGDTNSATIQWRGLQVNNLIITPNTPIVTPVGTGTWTIQFNNNYGLETFTVNGSGDNETYTYNSDGLLESRTTNYATPLGNGVTQEEWYYTYVLNNTRTGSRRMVFIADNNNYGIDERIHYFQNSDYIGEARVLYEVINGNPTINSPTIDRDTPITTVTSNGQEFHASTGFVSQRFLATGPQFQNVGTGVAFINPLTQELDIVTNFPSNNTTNLNGTSQTISIVSGVIEI